MEKVSAGGPISLGDFLKWVGAVPTGGQAKRLIQGGDVLVNGRPELRRGRRVGPGDRVEVRGGGGWLLE